MSGRVSCVFVVLFSLSLISCRHPLAADSSTKLPGDSSTLIAAMWKNEMTTCGATTWKEVLGGIAEYKNFAWAAEAIPVSDIDRNMNHVEWRVTTSIKPGTPYRVWNFVWKRWDTEWVPINSGGEDPFNNSLATTVEKRNGVVTFNGFKNPPSHHLNCATLPVNQ